MNRDSSLGKETPAADPVAPKSNRILIVDDESTIRIALRRFFTRMGWTVDEASNGEIALSILTHDALQRERPRFSLVLSDLRMPGLSGIELYERLRLEQPWVLQRLVFSTGDLVSEEAASFVKHTDCIVLQKPFELAALREVVDRIVAGLED
ncbi:MAG: response regulator [Gemmatimonadaceae bacterium]